MQDLSNGVRYNLIRIGLVEAIIAASEHERSDRSSCDCSICENLESCSTASGLLTIEGGNGLQHELPTLIDIYAEDALSVLSNQLMFGSTLNTNVFSGYLELPQGALLAYQYFEESHSQTENGPRTGQLILLRQTAFILATCALPDSYLDFILSRTDKA